MVTGNGSRLVLVTCGSVVRREESRASGSQAAGGVREHRAGPGAIDLSLEGESAKRARF